MSLAYTLRESFSGFSRTKLSTFVSIVTIGVSLMFLGVFAFATIHTSRFIDTMRDKVELETFLQEPLSHRELDELRKKVSSVEGVDSIEYVSKDDAARIFKEEFGEDILSVLEFNPLPPSIKVFLRKGHKTAEGAAKVSGRLEDIKGVESVRYRKELLELIDTRAETVHKLTLGLGVLISLSAIFLVSNTIRLAIYAKRQLLRTMELVGATSAFIRIPFLLEGIMQGLIGGALASGTLYVIIEYATRFLLPDFSAFVYLDPLYYIGVVIGGIVLGLTGSIISVQRFIGVVPRAR